MGAASRGARPPAGTGGAVAAVDLGASGGRVMVGQVGHGQLELHEVHRFPNTPVRVLGTLHWDILSLYRGMLDGLGMAARSFELASVGIDSWGVDYGLLDAGGALLGNPVHYRDTPDRRRGGRRAGQGAGGGPVRGHRGPADADQHDLPAGRRGADAGSWPRPGPCC